MTRSSQPLRTFESIYCNLGPWHRVNLIGDNSLLAFAGCLVNSPKISEIKRSNSAWSSFNEAKTKFRLVVRKQAQCVFVSIFINFFVQLFGRPHERPERRESSCAKVLAVPVVILANEVLNIRYIVMVALPPDGKPFYEDKVKGYHQPSLSTMTWNRSTEMMQLRKLSGVSHSMIYTSKSNRTTSGRSCLCPALLP